MKSSLLSRLRLSCGGRRHAMTTYPLSYDLRTPDELCAFIVDFALTRAEGCLRTFVKQATTSQEAATHGASDSSGAATTSSHTASASSSSSHASSPSESSSTASAATAMRLVERLLRFRTLIVGQGRSGASAAAWPTSLLQRQEASLVLGGPESRCGGSSSLDKALVAAGGSSPLSAAASDAASPLLPKTLLASSEARGNGFLIRSASPAGAVKAFGAGIRLEADTDLCVSGGPPLLPSASCGSLPGQLEAARLLASLDAIPAQQTSLGSENGFWVLKSPTLNCGRGITVHSEILPLLLEAKQQGWKVVVQKYIENSLLIKQRKCDIRLWVLVTSWSPAVVWIHPEPYFRLAGKALSFDQAQVSDLYMHLTNRCVSKTMEEEGGQQAAWKSAETDEDHIMLLPAFFEWADKEMPVVAYPGHSDSGPVDTELSQAAGVGEYRQPMKTGSAREAWAECTWPRIVAAVQTAVLACQADVGQHPEGCFEMFGFDFMLDKHLRPWLLEANASPDLCEDAGPALRQHTETALGDLFDLVIGLQEGRIRIPDTGATSWKRDEAVPGSGCWRLYLREPPPLVSPDPKPERPRQARQQSRASFPSTAAPSYNQPTRLFAPWPGKETHPKVIHACLGEAAGSSPVHARALENLMRHFRTAPSEAAQLQTVAAGEDSGGQAQQGGQADSNTSAATPAGKLVVPPYAAGVRLIPGTLPGGGSYLNAGDMVAGAPGRGIVYEQQPGSKKEVQTLIKGIGVSMLVDSKGLGSLIDGSGSAVRGLSSPALKRSGGLQLLGGPGGGHPLQGPRVASVSAGRRPSSPRRRPTIINLQSRMPANASSLAA
eukprot:TRINITY_DN13976_c0_g2_i1.p1 TRINITY_DN13976_c0_g2~~TRINITY_DN13976_c0_g2_i1.p1  ORF type:complete len:832 (+),score=175.10 TRINITY_DN13976_c0_g2_i1:433-2928(+)